MTKMGMNKKLNVLISSDDLVCFPCLHAWQADLLIFFTPQNQLKTQIWVF